MCKFGGWNRYGGCDFDFDTIENNIVHVATTPNPFAVMEDLGVDVKVEVIEAMIMEK